MFFKKLFGGGKETSSPTSKPVDKGISTNPVTAKWINIGWSNYDYKLRGGYQACAVSVDMAFFYADEREGLGTCIRVCVPVNPRFLDAKGRITDAFSKDQDTLHASFINSLSSNGVEGKLVGSLSYPCTYEFVAMLSPSPAIEPSLQNWASQLAGHPGMELYLGEGWAFYDAHLYPFAADLKAIETEKQFHELERAGTNKEAKHRVTHKFKGASKGIQALHDELWAADYWIEDKTEDSFSASKPLSFELGTFVAEVAAMTEACEKHELEYLGWTAPVVKAGVLSGDNKDGHGAYMYAKGSVYTGGFKNGLCHGKGKINFEAGDSYEGDWLMGKRTGRGIYRWSNIEYYEGEFFEGLLNGQGTYHYRNGNVYSGQWLNDKRSGMGTLTYKTGDRYVGDWKDDMRTGYGRLNYINPFDWYEGNFHENKFNGIGKEFSAAKVTVRCMRWEMDKAMEEVPLPTPQSCWIWSKQEGESNGLKEILQKHALEATAQGRVPVVYFFDSSKAPSLYLGHYAPLSEICEPFGNANILEINNLSSSEELINAGLPTDGFMFKLNPDGRYAGKSLGTEVWHYDRLGHANDKLKYFMMD